MKRSEMLNKILYSLANSEIESEIILSRLERYGMSPPATASKNVRPKDFPWGGGCNMRCNCDECNPEFIVYKWEPEE